MFYNADFVDMLSAFRRQLLVWQVIAAWFFITAFTWMALAFRVVALTRLRRKLNPSGQVGPNTTSVDFQLPARDAYLQHSFYSLFDVGVLNRSTPARPTQPHMTRFKAVLATWLYTRSKHIMLHDGIRDADR